MLIFADGWSEGFDGTGRRWVLYLKGCNMRCRWCTNPEGMNTVPEMLFYPARGREPEQACPWGAVRKEAGQYHLERGICDMRGTKPGELPFEQLTRIDLAIRQKDCLLLNIARSG